MSGWTDFASAFYRNKKRTNPNYKFSDALKEAGPLYAKSDKSKTQKQPQQHKRGKSRRRRTARRGRR